MNVVKALVGGLIFVSMLLGCGRPSVPVGSDIAAYEPCAEELQEGEYPEFRLDRLRMEERAEFERMSKVCQRCPAAPRCVALRSVQRLYTSEKTWQEVE